MNKTQKDFISNIEEPISMKFYIYFIIFIFASLLIKYIFSKEEIIVEIEKIKNKTLTLSEKISFFTKINTKINRDYLDNSNFYNQKSFKEIFGKEINNDFLNINKGKTSKKDIKKVKFSNIDVFDYDN